MIQVMKLEKFKITENNSAKKYSTKYKFAKNNIEYEANVEGIIFDNEKTQIKYLQVSKLNKGISDKIINAVCLEIYGMDISFDILTDAKLMESKSNGAYTVMINDDSYDITVNIQITVITDPFELLK